MVHVPEPEVPPVVPPLDALLALPHLGINLACGIRGCLASAVRSEHPRDLRVWPGLGQWEFDGRVTPGGHAVMVIEPSLAGVATGPGRLRPLPPALTLPLPPRDAEEHQRLRRAIRVEDDATVIVFPVRAASDDLRVLWPALTDADRASLDDQLTWNLELQHRLLASDEPDRAKPPSRRRAEQLTLDEANVRARAFLVAHPESTIRQLAAEIPCSVGHAQKTPAWRAVQERKKKLAASKSVRAVPVNPQILQGLVDDQRADMERDQRVPARRVARQRKRWDE